MDKKVKAVDFSGTSEQKAAIEKFKREIENSVEIYKLMAEARKISYDEHVRAGFIPEQALELCRV